MKRLYLLEFLLKHSKITYTVFFLSFNSIYFKIKRLFKIKIANYSIDFTTGKQTNFAYVFGVLFSSLTGIMAGANMSGELKNPAKSIPIGTMSAVVFVFCVYFLENLLLAASCEQ